MSDAIAINEEIENLLNSIFINAVQAGLTHNKNSFFVKDMPEVCEIYLPANSVILGARFACDGSKDLMAGFQLSFIKNLLSHGPNYYYFAQLSTGSDFGFDFTERALQVDPEQKIGKTLEGVLPNTLETYEDAIPILEGDLIPYLHAMQNINLTNQPTVDFALVENVLANDSVLE